MSSLVTNIIKEQLRDNKRIYLDRLILLVCSLLLFAPFFYLFGKVSFGIWLALFFLADISLTSKSARVFSFRKANLFEDSLPLRNIDQFKIKIFFTLVDYLFEIIVISFILVVFIFDIRTFSEASLYIPFVCFQIVFLASIPRNFKMIDIDLRRLDSPLKSLMKMISAILLLLILGISGAILISLLCGWLFNFEIGVLIQSLFENELALVVGTLIFDSVVFKTHILKRQIVNEHKVRAFNSKDFDQLIKSTIKPLVVCILLVLVTLPLSIYFCEKNRFSYLLFKDLNPRENSIYKIVLNKDVDGVIKKINNKEFFESNLSWFKRKNTLSILMKSNNLEVIRGATSYNDKVMFSEICQTFVPKVNDCDAKLVSIVAISKNTTNLMSYLFPKLTKKEQTDLLKYSIDKCKLNAVKFYAKKMNVSLLDKAPSSNKTIVKMLSNNKNKSCWRKVKRELF